ncbi:RNA methyltransferase [Saccharothrix violaceirubra]|uniref:TrmH family RNA methyltransferase n=1 Tax=Saccharothrix violaceirubra TaxID=413306 RepID=A0A7W7WZG7_9PSEU|nr:TrmH family RNA methyltransferase [Saccharothrix violaceirubra]MBB4969470.1 TrmH family RNA methyltransferase [Saccharothrix violaceirubra]
MKVLLEGFHAVKHALRFGAHVDPLLVLDLDATLDLARSHAPDLVDEFAARAEPATSAGFARVLGHARSHPTGVVGVADRPSAADPLVGRSTPVVLLDNPRNLGNFGAVIRVAAGLGAGGVVSTGEVDPWHPNVVRGSAGLHFAVPVGRVADVGLIRGEVVAFDAGGADLRDVRLPDDAVLAFGSERHGLSPAVRDRADRVVSLPMRERVSSYNLTTSVAMALYHWELFRTTS